MIGHAAPHCVYCSLTSHLVSGCLRIGLQHGSPLDLICHRDCELVEGEVVMFFSFRVQLYILRYEKGAGVANEVEGSTFNIQRARVVQ